MDSTSLLSTVKETYPDLIFCESDGFRWAPAEKTVYMGILQDERDFTTLFHEIGHALADHRDYDQDIELLRLEREAWTIARTQVAPQFDRAISDDLIEEALDSYRGWLHARSLCPECNQNGIQRSANIYACLLCSSTWRVNDARRCGLKRYRLTQTKTPA